MAKKPRLCDSDSTTSFEEVYSAATSTEIKHLHFSGFDEGIAYTPGETPLVLLDNVVTTGGTLAATCRLLRKFDANARIRQAVVIYTEGSEPFATVPISEDEQVEVVALGGHIPILRQAQLAFAGSPILVDRPLQPEFTWKSSARFPTYFSQPRNVHLAVFENVHGKSALALAGPDTFVAGQENAQNRWENVLVRVHDACITSECFHSCKCDCREQLEMALRRVGREGGMVIYLFQEGRGIGIGNKMKAYYYQQMALYNTVQANRALGLPDDARSYVAVRDILAYFQIASIRLLTNNPRKVHELTKLGVAVAERVPHVVDQAQSPLCAKYLHDKAVSMGHAIPSSAYQDLFTQSCFSDTVRFYEPDAPNGFLSNFYPSPIVAHTPIRPSSTFTRAKSSLWRRPCAFASAASPRHPLHAPVLIWRTSTVTQYAKIGLLSNSASCGAALSTNSSNTHKYTTVVS